MNITYLAPILAALFTMSSVGCNVMQSHIATTNPPVRGNKMASVTVERLVNAPVEQVFSTWNGEFADIYKYNPGLSSSHLLDDSPASCGLGATRQCNLSDGKNWIRERVVEIERNRKIVIDIYEGTMPLKTAMATLVFHPLSDTQTRVHMTMEFEPKMGIVGKAMVPMMKMKFRPMLQGLLDANAEYVEQGKQVNHEIVMN